MPKNISKIITVEEIISIHDMMIERYGGEKGILNMGELEFIVDWVNSHPEKPLFWKVAVLMRGIISAHPFVDGNKRTGFEVADIILTANGYAITASDEEIMEFVIKLAMEVVKLDEIIDWLKSNTKKIK
jgi:death-on-curing protein